jgi:hypothetical protein
LRQIAHSRFFPYSIIVMEYGETPIFGSHLFSVVANCHLLRPVRFPNQIRPLLVCDVPPSKLIPAHPNDSRPLVGKFHLLDLVVGQAVLLDDLPTVVAFVSHPAID